MQICIQIGGKIHCFYVPVIQWPVIWHKPGPGPVNYPALFQDAVVLASLQNAAQALTEGSVRTAVVGGISSAVKALQQHAGADVTVKMEGGH
jgi:hypothetical protein